MNNYPSSPSAPYYQASMNQSPYPSTNSSPYPPTNPSPYPPTNPSPYPPTNTSSYPAMNYPPTNVSPYPPMNYPSTNPSTYPPINSSPFPPSSQYPGTYISTPNYPTPQAPFLPSAYGSGIPSINTNNPQEIGFSCDVTSNLPYPIHPYPIANPAPPSNWSNNLQPSYGGASASAPAQSFHPSNMMYPSMQQPVPQPQNSAYGSGQSTSNYPQNFNSTQHPNLIKGIPTVHPTNPFDARQDADALHRAMKGFGTNEQALINILCRRPSSQRTQITLTYKTMFGKDLKSRLKSELSHNFERVMVALTYSYHEYLAVELHDAMKGLGTKETTLIDILCPGSNYDINAIKPIYMQLYKRSLEQDIKGDTSGDFCRILVALSQGNRDESQQVDFNAAKQDAQRLYAAGPGRLGTDESTFISILASRSWAHLSLVASEYQKVCGRSLESSIKSEFSGYTETALLAIIQCSSNRNMYFARRLKESMAGLGTKDRDLIRLVVSHCDTDLGTIKQEYQKFYGKDLAMDIGSETSGDYKKALVTLSS